jgi:hypothetical protein
MTNRKLQHVCFVDQLKTVWIYAGDLRHPHAGHRFPLCGARHVYALFLPPTTNTQTKNKNGLFMGPR